MRSTKWGSALAFLFLFTNALSVPAGRIDDADEAAARALFERNLAAIEARDAGAYLACYLHAPTLVRNGFAGVRLGYASLAEGVDGDAWPDAFEARDLQVHRLRDGVVYGQYRYRVRYGDRTEEGISERVFLRTDEGWRIAVTTAFAAPPGALPPLEEDTGEGRP